MMHICRSADLPAAHGAEDEPVGDGCTCVRHYRHMSRGVQLLACLVVLVGAALSGCGSDDGSATTGDLRASSCRSEDPPTAGNRVIWFLGDVQHGRDPTIEGGVDDPFGCAYEQMCAPRRNEVSEAEFRRTEGEAVSELLSADSHAGPSVYVDRGLSQSHPALESLASEVTESWVEVKATWYEHIADRTIVSGSGREEHWRVDLVREDGAWRVCEFTPIER